MKKYSFSDFEVRLYAKKHGVSEMEAKKQLREQLGKPESGEPLDPDEAKILAEKFQSLKRRYRPSPEQIESWRIDKENKDRQEREVKREEKTRKQREDKRQKEGSTARVALSELKKNTPGGTKQKPRKSTEQQGKAAGKARRKSKSKSKKKKQGLSARYKEELLTEERERRAREAQSKEQERKAEADYKEVLEMGKAARQRGAEQKEAAIAKEKLGEKAMVSETHQQLDRSLSPGNSVVERLHFRILPPGDKTSVEVTNYFRKFQTRDPKAGREIQWQRLKDIEKLKPVRRWVGEDTWTGYIVYEFSSTQNVILDCPIKGNAVYVLKGNVWGNLAQLSKGEIRDKHQGSYERVVHKGGWLARTKRALHRL